VGTILAVSLLVAPTAVARLWSDDVRVLYIASPLVGGACGAVGIVVSLEARTAAGATIALVAGAALAASAAARWAVDRARHPGVHPLATPSDAPSRG
jgi:manganese/iron transport system permease protein